MGNGAHMSMTPPALSALLVVFSLNLPGCFWQSSGPSEVAQGRYFSAGRPDYDEFFLAVHRLQLQMASAPGEIAEARRALSSAVISGADASNAQLAEKVKVALDRLGERGVRTRVEFRSPTPPDPEHTMAILTPWSSPTGSDRQVFEGIEASLTRILRFVATMRRANGRLTELRSAVPRLEAGIEAAFHDQSRGRRRRVEANLRDSERVSVLMLARVDELGRPAEALVTELLRTLGPNFKLPASAPPPEPPAPAPEPPPPRQRANQDPRPRTSPAAEPKAKPASEPAKSADFEP